MPSELPLPVWVKLAALPLPTCATAAWLKLPLCTPVIALFGPSDPRRYGPLATHQRVLRVQLPCSPCGQVRLPPERCRGHVPDCMDGITVDAVVDAAQRWLRHGVDQ